MPRVAVALALLLGMYVPDALAGDRPGVTVLLTPSPNLSTAARMSLMREATGIWARAGIRLSWVSPASPSEAGLSLRVLVVERTTRGGGEDAALLGELVRGAGTTPVAMIALDQATAVAARAQSPLSDLNSEERLGLILGRVVAHEIGHFLLAATPHTREGLMRAQFPEMELTDRWSTTFEVTPPARVIAQTAVVNGFPARIPAAALPAVTATPAKPGD